MKLQTPNCPECGNPAIMSINTSIIVHHISIRPDDSVEWLNWKAAPDTIEPYDTDPGYEHLECPNGHRWHSMVEPD